MSREFEKEGSRETWVILDAIQNSAVARKRQDVGLPVLLLFMMSNNTTRFVQHMTYLLFLHYSSRDSSRNFKCSRGELSMAYFLNDYKFISFRFYHERHAFSFVIDNHFWNETYSKIVDAPK